MDDAKGAVAGGSLERFVRLARHLQGRGLAAPDIHKVDTDNGLAVISDLGEDRFAAWIDQHRADPFDLYRAATDVLIHIGRSPPPADLGILAPTGVGRMLEPLFASYAPDTALPLRDAIVAEIAALMERLCTGQPVLCLRDYHAENLIWRPDRTGLQRVGILDFQDAIIADPTYDLASLLRDARRETGDALTAAVVHHFAASCGEPVAKTHQAMTVMAVLRNLRILGIFTALARSGRRHYLDHVPNTLRLLRSDLEHPHMISLSGLLLQGVIGPKAVSNKAISV